jgi:RNA 2',3'-cyclic 3'-phosphodiesterase
MARDRASRPEARPLRLFVAVDLPPDVRADLAGQTAALHGRVAGARWTPPENWHVTLHFLGRTWPRLLGWVVERVAEAAASTAPFRSSVRGIGAFPSWRRVRVLWAGLADEAGAFAGTAGAVQEALSQEFRPEDRAFAPHLTLARLNPPAPVDPADVGDLRPSRDFEVRRLVLYRSHLRRPAPVYEPLESFTLGGAG